MTPGTYLRKRRLAAQLTIEGAAAKLASLPEASGYSWPDRQGLLKQALIQIERDRAVLPLRYSVVVQAAYAFDAIIYIGLAARSPKVPRVCLDCGCSQNDPCCTAIGPCAWSSRRPQYCSACDDRVAAPPPFLQAANSYFWPQAAEAAHG